MIHTVRIKSSRCDWTLFRRSYILICMKQRRAFTIVELLVVIAIIALLVSILLPAIGKARDQAKLTQSMANLRNMGAGSDSYAAEWNGRQFTLLEDNIAQYADNADQAFPAYRTAHNGINHQGVILGWGYVRAGFPPAPTGEYLYFEWPVDGGHPETRGMVQPIVFSGGGYYSGEYFGSFRLINCRQWNVYMAPKYYDEIYFAPKDNVVRREVEKQGCFDDPGEFCAHDTAMTSVLAKPIWSSYVLSPAAMFNPNVMANPEKGGWTNPWTMPGGFRSPSKGQCRYSSLKTHIIEHHWLQARRSSCNPNFTQGTFDDGACEPWYFNHGWESNPATLFYDGHIETVGVRKAERADARVTAQAGYGLWSRDCGNWGADGYHIGASYDYANTSFHVLTTDGIMGRDILAD